jgi:glycosyltransferase involved in cell wall biosynthesis
VGAANRVKRTIVRRLRAALIRHARGGRQSQPPRLYILIMNAWAMGGTIRTTLNLAGYLAQHHEVEILSLMRRRDEPFFPVPPGVTITTIDDRRPSAQGSGLAGLARRLLSGRRSLLMNPADLASGRASLWTDIMLARALRTRTNGVLIATRPALNLVAASVAPRSLVRIGQEHMNLSTHRESMQRAIANGYAELDAVVTLTDRDLDAYRTAIPHAPLLAAIPNATPGFGARRSDPSARTVVAAGRLSRQKAFPRLIAAFMRVTAIHPDWQLVIYGSGPKRKYTERLIDDLGAAPNVTLAGPVEDIGAAMAAGSIFALSSRFEGFPMVLIEAMSVGLPVVSFDCPTGPREIVEHGRNGLLVPEGDIGALAAALIEMIEDEGLRRRCSEGALETAARYSPAVIGARWEELLEQVSRGSRPPEPGTTRSGEHAGSS